MNDLRPPTCVEPALSGMAQTPKDRPTPILRPGNTNCGGCGMSIGLNMLSRAVGSTQVQIVIPACCGIVTAGPYPYSAYGAPVVASTFASAAAVATGLAHVARLNGEDTRVVCWAGDGGTYDIGLATLSAAAERNEDILYICYDNEIYGNTGGQRSGATPEGAATTTTPSGKDVDKKDILGIMASHGIPYAASVSLAHPEDTLRKMRHALQSRGFRFLHILSPCPTRLEVGAGRGHSPDPAGRTLRHLRRLRDRRRAPRHHQRGADPCLARPSKPTSDFRGAFAGLRWTSSTCRPASKRDGPT